MAKAKPLPSQERLKELLDYDPETGIFLWKNPRCRRLMSGTEAGCFNTRGYRVIRIDGPKFKASRLAWMYVYGEDPQEFSIDHINRITSDNRICNLRKATHQQNTWNVDVKGFHWHKNTQKWRSVIQIHGKKIHLGLFDCPWAAYEAHWDARYKYFGEFA
jgi:hypothetical protein